MGLIRAAPPKLLAQVSILLWPLVNISGPEREIGCGSSHFPSGPNPPHFLSSPILLHQCYNQCFMNKWALGVFLQQQPPFATTIYHLTSKTERVFQN